MHQFRTVSYLGLGADDGAFLAYEMVDSQPVLEVAFDDGSDAGDDKVGRGNFDDKG